ncbi:hypothetical protein SAMN05518801_103185 [Novosphingobium sp. CF614]|nr:hypothetical protein SAMN05518801_103185 [Novosphingobium sp. CF614]
MKGAAKGNNPALAACFVGIGGEGYDAREQVHAVNRFAL